MSFSSDQPLLVNQLPLSIQFPKDDHEKFLEILTETYKRIANCTNTKTGGLYSIQELFNSEQFFTATPNRFRNVYRKTFDLVSLNGGNIGAGATVAFPHNITGLLYATLIYVSCTTASEFFTVVYPDAFMDPTNINFTNPSANAVTAAFFIAEYLKT
jgi:hypothetical protein